jgi:predicted GIY-YIG superfamily endonuclease
VFVYWIKSQDHTDAYSQGYIGVSSKLKKRFVSHKNKPPNQHFKNAIQKHGWDKLEKQVIFTGSEEACLAFEVMLRPNKHIGWNTEPGGSKPPVHKGVNNVNFGRGGEMSGVNCPNTKGTVIASNIKTNTTIVLCGNKDMASKGFDFRQVSDCLLGKQKTHRGHTFTRINIKE